MAFGKVEARGELEEHSAVSLEELPLVEAVEEVGEEAGQREQGPTER